ncbi:zinc finger BED domain-containing protein 1-like [Solea senegalensis]|uniref:Zinc finger BED domain-containing protein 1-like n=1 Tax=Solea senegalensis TaxID=28829 RepID=A0AAV6PWP6_SOLSE|nr:zinc finger BED domain-containing protein 1-like [Solea senegalensis]
MIERVLEQEQAISQVLAADKKTRHLVLTSQDLEVLESVHKALKPLLEFTNALSASILDYMREKYSDPSTNDLLDMASLVDPTFKITYCTEENVEDIKSRAINEMEAMLCETDQGTAELAASLPKDATTISQPAEPLRKNSLGSLFKTAATSSATLSQRERIEKELSAYFQSFPIRKVI